MKILYLVSGIGPPAAWGSEYIQNLIFALSKKGVKATIISPIYIHTKPGWRSWVKKQEKKCKVRIITLEAPAFIRKRFLLHLALTPFFSTVTATKILSKEKFDLIHEFTSTPMVGLRTFLFKIFFQTPSVITLSVHNNTILGKLFGFKIFNFAKYYLIPSHELVDKLKSIGINKNKIIYSPPSIDLVRFRKKISKSSARDVLGLPKQKLIFSYFGPLTPEKGALDILEGAKKLKKPLQKDILLVLFTHPSRRFKQHKMARGQIESHRLPFLKVLEKHVDIPTLLAASDCVILPQQTGHGTTIPPVSIIETLVSAKPIITTGTLGVEELVGKKEGTVIPPKSPRLLTQAIEKFCYKKKKYQKNMENFDIKKSLILHLSIYKQTCNF